MLVGKILRKDAGDVDVGLLGIADILLAHHVGDARGFGLDWKRSTLSGANFVRSKCERMLSMTSMVMPGPFGGHCQAS